MVAFEHAGRKIYGLQFHPEVSHTLSGAVMDPRALAELFPDGWREAGCPVEADVTSEAALEAMTQSVNRRTGRIDILHNNVGIVAPGGVVEQSEEDWDRVVAVNLKSMFLCCKHVLPTMQHQRSGVITNISSTAALWSRMVKARDRSA